MQVKILTIDHIELPFTIYHISGKHIYQLNLISFNLLLFLMNVKPKTDLQK